MADAFERATELSERDNLTPLDVMMGLGRVVLAKAGEDTIDVPDVLSAMRLLAPTVQAVLERELMKEVGNPLLQLMQHAREAKKELEEGTEDE